MIRGNPSIADRVLRTYSAALGTHQAGLAPVGTAVYHLNMAGRTFSVAFTASVAVFRCIEIICHTLKVDLLFWIEKIF